MSVTDLPEFLGDASGPDGLDLQAHLFADMAQGFAATLELSVTLENAIERFMTHLDAEAASIFLLDPDESTLVCRACAGPVDIRGLRLDARQGIVGKTMRERSAQMVRDVRLDPDFAASVDAGTGFVTRSILCAPLVVRHQCIGALELINKRSGDGLFSNRDRHLVNAIAASAALAIHNARMAAQLVEQERVRKELELAREIQLSFLPAPQAPDFPIVGRNIPAQAVSGDFFDFLELPDGRIYFSLGDVSGKGMNAALLMARTSSLMRLLAKRTEDPGRLLAEVNDELCETATRGMFVTLVCGFVEPAAGRVLIANAGHQPSLLRRPDGAYVELPASAPPLAVIPEVQFEVDSIDLHGGVLYLFSDGVTESYVRVGERLNVDGLRRAIDAADELPLGARLDRILDSVQRPGFEQHDDITLLLVGAGR